MADSAELDKAIGAHGMWKGRLRSAIESGKTDTPVEKIRRDDQCAFGKWLYGTTLSSLDKGTEHYRTVKDLHAEFHRTAARVAELAAAGRTMEAEKMLDFNGEYAEISARLTQAMMAWKKVSR